jgi:4-hydroxybenzoyl-CoA thioesterase
MHTVEYQFQINWGDTDAAGIVFYPNFYKWMDQASHHFFSVIGYPSSHLFVEEKIGLPLLEAQCKFYSPLFFDESVTIQTRIEEIKEKVFTLKHRFLREEQAVAEGYEIRAWAFLGGEKPKAHPIPEPIRQKMNDFKEFA